MVCWLCECGLDVCVFVIEYGDEGEEVELVVFFVL